MKKTITMFSLLLTTFLFCQKNHKVGDTIYYRKNVITKNISEADYYSVIKTITKTKINKFKFRLTGYKKLDKSSNYLLHSEYETDYPEIKTAEGFQRFYHKNGVKASEGIAKKGRSVGFWKHWYDNGNIMDEITIPENEALSKKFKHFTIKNFWTRDGQQTIKNGNGSFENKSENSTTKGYYKNGLRHGKFSSTQYGIPYYEEYYKKGKLISGISLDKNGKKYKYNQVFDQPRYKSGQKSISKHIIKNFKIPSSAYENKTFGRILVSFRIKKNGTIDDIKIARGVCPDCDKEAIRVVKLLGKWKPAKSRGQNVNVRYTLPITFNL